MDTAVRQAQVIPEWTLADRLRKARAVGGANQRQFATLLGVTGSAYAQWEAGNNRPRDVVAVARRIEALTGVPAAWVLGLPHLDSNQEPAGYSSDLLSALHGHPDDAGEHGLEHDADHDGGDAGARFERDVDACERARPRRIVVPLPRRATASADARDAAGDAGEAELEAPRAA